VVGGYTNGTCVTSDCPTYNLDLYLFDTTCPGVTPTHCEAHTDCKSCTADAACSFCGDSFTGSGVCVQGTNKCTHDDTVTTCPFDICPLLTCAQCVDTYPCSWCGTSAAGKCQRDYCDAGVDTIYDTADCTATPTTCEAIDDCAACFAATGCQYCQDDFFIDTCVTGAAGVCGSASITAAMCPTTGGAGVVTTAKPSITTPMRTTTGLTSQRTAPPAQTPLPPGQTRMSPTMGTKPTTTTVLGGTTKTGTGTKTVTLAPQAVTMAKASASMLALGALSMLLAVVAVAF